jgi:hypothetical protein
MTDAEKLAAIVAYCEQKAAEFNEAMPFTIRPEDVSVDARTIFAIIREKLCQQ